MSLLTCLRKEWIELSRTSRLLVLLIVLGFFGLSSPLLAKYTPEMMTLIPGGEAIASIIPVPSLVDAITQYVKNIGQFGILLAGAVMVAVPDAWLERYLGGDALLSLIVVAVLGAVIYVCAVAHIPLVATLLAAGAAPGAAIVFLLSEGAAFVSGACLRIDGAAPNARRHWMMAAGAPSPEFDGFHRSRKPRVLGG